MHGWFIECIEKLVLSKFGPEIWSKIKGYLNLFVYFNKVQLFMIPISKVEANCEIEDGKWIRLQVGTVTYEIGN
jgi:hypothetical protein